MHFIIIFSVFVMVNFSILEKSDFAQCYLQQYQSSQSSYILIAAISEAQLGNLNYEVCMEQGNTLATFPINEVMDMLSNNPLMCSYY